MSTSYLKLCRTKQQYLFLGQDIITLPVHTTTHNGWNVTEGTTLKTKKLKTTHPIIIKNTIKKKKKKNKKNLGTRIRVTTINSTQYGRIQTLIINWDWQNEYSHLNTCPLWNAYFVLGTCAVPIIKVQGFLIKYKHFWKHQVHVWRQDHSTQYEN